MAEVWEAFDDVLHRTVAIKVVLEELSVDPTFKERFLREARLAAALEHPHIVPVFDFGQARSVMFLVTPYLAGGSLSERLLQKPSREQCLEWLSHLASALDYAHENGIVHRDLKPANILFDVRGCLYLGDFGIAKSVGGGPDSFVTKGDMVLGTPAYMAPEQALSKKLDGRADQYSLGVLAYRMLTGSLPFGSLPPALHLVRLVSETAPPPSSHDRTIRPEVDRVFTRVLAAERENRYPNCTAFIADLSRVLAPPARVPLPPPVASGAEEFEAGWTEAVRTPVSQTAPKTPKPAASGTQGRGVRAAANGPAQRQPTPAPSVSQEKPHPGTSPTESISGNRAPEAVPAAADTRTGTGPSNSVWPFVLGGTLLLVFGILLAGALLFVGRSCTGRQPAVSPTPERPVSKSPAGPELSAERAVATAVPSPQPTATMALLPSATPVPPPPTATLVPALSPTPVLAATSTPVPAATSTPVPAAAPTPYPKTAIIEPRVGVRFRPVPPGTFQMGCTAGDPDCYPQEVPARQVSLPDLFYMGETEVTNAQYSTCVGKGPCTPPGAGLVTEKILMNLPVTGVTWEQADVFCRFVGGRLPTEAEWEWAARGGRNGWRYPSGETLTRDAANFAGAGGRDTWDRLSPAAHFPPNGFGLFDMAGNAAEWCAGKWVAKLSLYSPFFTPDSPAKKGSKGTAKLTRPVRGGNYLSPPRDLRVSFRTGLGRTADLSSVGFRCMRDVPQGFK